MRIGIVIIGYKNQTGVKRLLKSLDSVDFLGDKNITLIFSIDFSSDSSVETIATQYNWAYGEKHINAYRSNLGLRKHILSCGNYMNIYNLDALVVLEDDIYLSPCAYKYIKDSIDFYKDNPRIAGIALYKHEYNINAGHPFIEYLDRGDTFFIQYAMSWGQVWLKDKWEEFISWYNEKGWERLDSVDIPENILHWKNSWLKYHIMYCIERNMYFVYPRNGLSTDFSDPGAHNKSISTAMQIRLDMGKKDWIFNNLDETKAVYDAFFENTELKRFLGIPDLVVDLYGAKIIPLDASFVLTRRRMPYKVIKKWGLYLRPIEANVFQDVPGDEIFLYDTSIKNTTKSKKSLQYRYYEYDLKGINIVSFKSVRYSMNKIINHIKASLSR